MVSPACFHCESERVGADDLAEIAGREPLWDVARILGRSTAAINWTR